VWILASFTAALRLGSFTWTRAPQSSVLESKDNWPSGELLGSRKGPAKAVRGEESLSVIKDTRSPHSGTCSWLTR